MFLCAYICLRVAENGFVSVSMHLHALVQVRPHITDDFMAVRVLACNYPHVTAFTGSFCYRYMRQIAASQHVCLLGAGTIGPRYHEY